MAPASRAGTHSGGSTSRVRLVEVRERCKGQELSFTEWVENNFEFTRQTAYNLMKLAGSGEEEREEKKAKDRERKRNSRQATVGRQLFNCFPSDC